MSLVIQLHVSREVLEAALKSSAASGSETVSLPVAPPKVSAPSVLAEQNVKKRGRPPGTKNKAPEKIETPEDDEHDEIGDHHDDEHDEPSEAHEAPSPEDDEHDEIGDGDDEEEEDDKVDESEKKKLIEALRSYAKVHGKEKAVKILIKLGGSKASADVKKADLPKLLKALKV